MIEKTRLPNAAAVKWVIGEMMPILEGNCRGEGESPFLDGKLTSCGRLVWEKCMELTRARGRRHRGQMSMRNRSGGNTTRGGGREDGRGDGKGVMGDSLQFWLVSPSSKFERSNMARATVRQTTLRNNITN
jgi:hypothetical protein